jgi:hypothetical protein
MKKPLSAGCIMLWALLLPGLSQAQSSYGPATITYPTTAGDCVKIAPQGGGYIADAGAACGSGTGTVSSITAGTGLTATPNPIVGTGTISLANPSATTIGGVQSVAPVANQFLTGISASGVPSQAQPAISGISGLATGVATFLGTPTSANLAAAVTDETGTGPLVFSAGPTLTGQATIQSTTGTSPGWYAQITGDTSPRVGAGLNVNDTASIGFGTGSATRDTFIERAGAAVIRFGSTDAAAPVAQTLVVQSVATGTTNTAGQAFIIRGSAGTGTGVGGSITFATAGAGSTGSTQNAEVNRWSVGTTGNFAPASDNLYDLGGVGSRIRNLWVANTAMFGSCTIGTLNACFSGSVGFNSGIIIGGTPPVLTGTCTTASQVGGNIAGKFAATCVAQTVIMTFAATAPNGWNCNANDNTTPADTLKQTAFSTTSCTLTGTTVASDVITFNAVGF